MQHTIRTETAEGDYREEFAFDGLAFAIREGRVLLGQADRFSGRIWTRLVITDQWGAKCFEQEV